MALRQEEPERHLPKGNLKTGSAMPMSRWVILSLAVTISNSILFGQETKRPFTVADDIGLTTFMDLDGFPPEIRFSPDGKYFAVWSERGNLKLNRVEDSLNFYRTSDIEGFLQHTDLQLPSPVWVLTRSNIRGRVIDHWCWLTDSSGVAFLERSGDEAQRLEVADLRKKSVEPLTSEAERIDSFDISDRGHYVYLTTDLVETNKKRKADSEAAAVVATGRDPLPLLFPDDERLVVLSHKLLWAVADGKRWQVKRNGEPLNVGEFALSPDGSSIVGKLAISDVPGSWEKLYPPPYEGSPDNHVHAGSKNVSQYVLFNLKTGSVEPLTDAPVSDDAGWYWGGSGASWSGDGKKVLLSGTFLKSSDGTPSRPCMAVVDIASKASECVEVMKVRTPTTSEPGYHFILGADFVPGNNYRVVFHSLDRTFFKDTEYQRNADSSWKLIGQFDSGRAEHGNLEITVEQNLNEPQRLVAHSKERSRVLWDPNRGLESIALAEATVFTWKDKEGNEVKGGLYKPVNYKPGVRYPLVIQTHGFGESDFIPSGVFPSAFAAQELANAGIMVLQAEDSAPGCSGTATPEEGPCAVSAYESAARQLVSGGLVDPDNIGIIGFSRSCYYVMEMLTTSSLHLRAASVADGVMFDYLQYIEDPQRMSGEANTMMGAAPFGEGLQKWLQHSPGFNLDKVNTPLMVTGTRQLGLFLMWQPYAGLHYLKKPVELMMLNTEEHVFTNPAVRMASQGGTVDWFRFWLQGYEDPDPAKAEQYKRWRELRKMQAENETNAVNKSVPSLQN